MRVLADLNTRDAGHGHRSTHTDRYPGQPRPQEGPCPRRGNRRRRKRSVNRRARTVAYNAVACLEITRGEYTARCECSTTFRNTHEDVPPRAAYDDKVRALVLDHILKDGLSAECTLPSLEREFLLDLSKGFIYDELRDQVAQLDLATHRRKVLEHFSGTPCVDEPHLGRFTLLPATDPLSDLPVAFALVAANDQDHVRRFLGNLKTRGLVPGIVVTDGSNLVRKVFDTPPPPVEAIAMRLPATILAVPDQSRFAFTPRIWRSGARLPDCSA
jgi:hypothetical protein